MKLLNPACFMIHFSKLHKHFNPTRLQLLENRKNRQAELDQGVKPDFLADTEFIRNGNWKIAPVPSDLQDRRVEITGPVDRKMIINALNSGVKVFMADFEDSNSPTWDNNINGQIVTTLFDGVKNIGKYSAMFDASNLNSGVYYYSLEVNGVKESTKRMAMIK